MLTCGMACHLCHGAKVMSDLGSSRSHVPVLGMSFRKVTLLDSNWASVTDLKRIQTPHSLCCDFGGDKTFTSGGTIQV